MLAPVLLMPRAADISTPTDVERCYVWHEESATTLTSWVDAEDEGG